MNSSAPISILPSGPGVLLRFFLILFFGAMVVGPLLFFALRDLVPFHRAMNRALLICALAAMATTWSRLHLRAWWPLDRRAVWQVLLGLLIALISVQTILGLNIAFGGLTWATVTSHDRMRLVLTALTAAIIVPLTEETIFRGFLQTEISKRLGMLWAWLLTALIFALSHFLKVPVSFDHVEVHWWSGVPTIVAAVKAMCGGAFLSMQGLNYLVIGLILGGLFWRTGMLWLNYGLHAGWIIGLQLSSGLSRPAPTASIWTGGDLLSSPLTTVVLVLLGFWLWLFFRRPQPEPVTGANAP